LLAAFMFMASIPDVIKAPVAVAIFAHLGYPAYLLRFLGAAKLLGVITVLLPAAPRLKEWAYAGLVIDLIGALYSHLSAGDPPSAWLLPVIGLVLIVASYWLFRRLSTGESGPVREVLVPAHGARLANRIPVR
jgi:hypothetical protein